MLTFDKIIQTPLDHKHVASDITGLSSGGRTAVFNQDYTVLPTDNIIAITGNTDNLYFTLPLASAVTVAKVFIFKIEYADLGGFSIFIRPDGSDHIDGATEIQMNKPYESIGMYSNGSTWFLVKENFVSPTGDVLTGNLRFNDDVNLYFGSSGTARYMRYDTGEGKLWIATAADNEKLKFSYGGASGYLQVDQFGVGERLRLDASGKMKLYGTGQIILEVAGGLTVGEDLDHNGTKVGFYGATPVAQSSAYNTSNVSTDRSYDANATTTDELADVLGTLIADLKATGIIG